MVRKCAGFTLTEVIVTVAIVAIIGVVAVPSYFSYLQDSRRAEAHTALLALAQAQEQWFINNNTYTGTVANLQPLIPAIVNNNIQQGNYAYAITAANNTAFTLTATAQAAQAGDTACSVITLTSAGAQTPAGCWAN